MSLVRRFLDDLVAGSADEHPLDAWAERLEAAMQVTTVAVGDVVVEQHAIADAIHFLVGGTLRYEHVVSDSSPGETISAAQMPWMPVGWTGLHVRRYRATVHAETDGTLLSLPLGTWQEVAREEPRLLAHLSEFVFRKATAMLWQARGRTPQTRFVGTSHDGALTAAPVQEAETLYDLFQSSPALSPLAVECRRWLAAHTVLYDCEEGTTVLYEGDAVDGLWLLQLGRVALRFVITDHAGERQALRYVVRSGTLLNWSALDTPVPAPYTVETTRPTRFAVIPREALKELMSQHPEWVAAIFQQQLWKLRTYLTSTRVEAGHAPTDGGVGALEALVSDSMPLLPVNSLLYGVPHLLRNYLTRREGFERLYRTHFEGSEDERIVATLGLDLVRELERGHRFFVGMQATYDAVIQAGHLSPRELRKLATRTFRDALAHVPYAIAGWENLPDDPNCIVIYNHMAYAEDSILPNGFLFNPDSHFLSGMILEPKYGDGIRVARTNATTEFWRADYYDRLGHIAVVTRESGWLEETAEQKHQRKTRFLADCEAMLASGRPFSIAPEGTITDRDSVTERSPGPLRPGAFLMSARFPSRPRIVPVAFANFDKPAHRAVFAAVIKPPFSMDERGVDVDDPDAMAAFLEAYRREFRGHVEEAIELADAVRDPSADLEGVITNRAEVDAVNEEFEMDVRALELRRSPAVDRTGRTVFYGSSTFRMWHNLAEDLGVAGAINLGFGGSTLAACREYLDRLVVPYRPDRLVVYVGENDLFRGAGPDEVCGRFQRFADAVAARLPETRCWFVSIKPVPDREEHVKTVWRTNDLVAADIASRQQWRYIDWFRYMIDGSGRVSASLFSPDGVHVNEAGYGVLQVLLRRELAGAA